jgi:hypothetical protein
MYCLQKKYKYSIKKNEPWNIIRTEVHNYDFENNPYSIECKIVNIIISKLSKINITTIHIMICYLNDNNYITQENNKLFLENILYLLKKLRMRITLSANYITRIPSLLCCDKTYVYKLDLPLINNIILDYELYLTTIEHF